MKTKKLQKKLILNKTTVTHLNFQNMGAVHGGDVTGNTCGKPCETIDYTCGLFCDTVYYTCAATQCQTCYHTCPPTWCDTECGC